MKITNILYGRAAGLLRARYDRRLSGPPVPDHVEYFPAAERFAAAWQTLRDEALGIAANLSSVPRFHEIMPQQAPPLEPAGFSGQFWTVLFGKMTFGAKRRRACAKKPAGYLGSAVT